MNKLALLGGSPVRSKPFGPHPVVDPSTADALLETLKSNCFSGFRAGQEDGGPQVTSFENTMKSMIGTDYAVAFDTWSNGIFAILLSIGIEPGDEVILPAYTMTACASSVLACGGVPVFADIDENNYCLDPIDVKAKVSSKTKAIMVVHLFGMPADIDELLVIANKNGLILIEDAAQAPLSTYNNRMCGSIGHVGGFSFTESKHVMSGEGGIAVTNREDISNGLKYVRNHGEVNSLPGCRQPFSDNMMSNNLVGFNFRLTELAACLGNQQIRRLQQEVDTRRKFAEFLDTKLLNMPYFKIPQVIYDYEHSYYCYTLMWNSNKVSRDFVVSALNSEGIPFRGGYCQPIYKQHIYRDNQHWAIRDFGQHVSYDDLPVTEKVDKNIMVFTDMRSPNTISDMKDVVDGILKVIDYIELL